MTPPHCQFCIHVINILIYSSNICMIYLSTERMLAICSRQEEKVSCRLWPATEGSSSFFSSHCLLLLSDTNTWRSSKGSCDFFTLNSGILSILSLLLSILLFWLCQKLHLGLLQIELFGFFVSFFICKVYNTGFFLQHCSVCLFAGARIKEPLSCLDNSLLFFFIDLLMTLE